MADGRLVTAGRVGRSHGLDGRFHVLDPVHAFLPGTPVVVAGREHTVDRRGGTDERPLVGLAGVESREAARALGGELLLVPESELPIEAGEWLAADLVGCRVEGHGAVVRIVGGPSCDVLELEDGTLVPLITDAVRSVDAEAGVIEIDAAFLGLDTGSGG